MIKLLKIIRIKEWIHFLGVPILGYFFQFAKVSILDIILIIIVGVITLSYGFVINYWADFSNEYRPIRVLRGVSLLLIPTGLIILTFSFQAYVFWLLTILLLFLYSFPPFTLKRFPVIVTLVNGFSLASFFIFGFAIQRQVSQSAILFSLFLGLNLIPLQLIHEWNHKGEDLKNNCVSTASLFSIEVMKIILFSLYFLILIFAFYISYVTDLNFLFQLVSVIFVISSIFAISYFNLGGVTCKPRKILKVAGLIYGVIILAILIL